ncbi:MAG: hypothetical protein ACOX6V_05415 [Patescibacteria group bacterium]|jgi:hypothetical protein
MYCPIFIDWYKLINNSKSSGGSMSVESRVPQQSIPQELSKRELDILGIFKHALNIPIIGRIIAEDVREYCAEQSSLAETSPSLD